MTPDTEVTALRERVRELETVVRLLLDHIDYTSGACGLAEPVGGALPRVVLDLARAALAAKAGETP